MRLGRTESCSFAHCALYSFPAIAFLPSPDSLVRKSLKYLCIYATLDATLIHRKGSCSFEFFSYDRLSALAGFPCQKIPQISLHLRNAGRHSHPHRFSFFFPVPREVLACLYFISATPCVLVCLYAGFSSRTWTVSFHSVECKVRFPRNKWPTHHSSVLLLREYLLGHLTLFPQFYLTSSLASIFLLHSLRVRGSEPCRRQGERQGLVNILRVGESS